MNNLTQTLRKWNYATHKYDEVELPRGNYKTYSEDMSEIINCCQCYRDIEMGDSYTSMEFHAEFGFGYGVCEECCQKEMERRNKKTCEICTSRCKTLEEGKCDDCIKAIENGDIGTCERCNAENEILTEGKCDCCYDDLFA